MYKFHIDTQERVFGAAMDASGNAAEEECSHAIQLFTNKNEPNIPLPSPHVFVFPLKR